MNQQMTEREKAIESDYNFIIRFTTFMMAASTIYFFYTTSRGLKLFAIYHLFAPYPLVDALTKLPPNVNMWLNYSMLASIIWLFVTPNNRAPALIILIFQLIFVMQDFTRFRHTIYMQGFTLFSLVLLPRFSKEYRLIAIKIMLCGVYFWAGFHKINLTFYERVFPDFVINIYDYDNPSSSVFIRYSALAILYAVPFVEAAIGIFLLFPKTRKLGSFLAFIMFVVIIICVRPPQTNINATKGIWMWNIWLYIMEARLFLYGHNLSTPFFLFTRNTLSRVSVGMFCIAPFLAIWCTWFFVPGFKMYSGNRTEGMVSFQQEETFARVPAGPLRNALLSNHEIKLMEWMNAVQDSYFRGSTPELMKKSVTGLCKYLDHPESAKLYIQYPAWFYTMQREVEVVPMCPENQINK